MAESLAQKVCTPCRGGISPLTQKEAAVYLSQTPGWGLENEGRWLRRKFKFADFRESQSFIDKVGRLAEEQGHHPDICFGWGYATVSLQTHKIKGLHENDFIMASKISELAGP
ncbi:4a-hydroxytetrahydrobiopterin dehydratase [Pseudaminobacter soli (ex Li et al. 2025)]|uniref:Putative pterin-4-alpha-carbinolamine dehydratase n=1 Tax=Pseudaminobacter soli (ex Li et al. 2025) TaxID=1295366 RepID=A0A2P7S0T4_9HYPH|nr:4a-hydroxytetrahydrobiopterin dehydratase [Mesorhizobium soli]PSJ56084.1 pterin-4-alpha-carbinolamine dehydratase [Mesorhizobium soli]